MTQHSFVKKTLLLSGVALFAFAAPAQAGFEWKGPLETPSSAASGSAPEAPAMQAVPTTPVDAQSMNGNSGNGGSGNALPSGATPADAMSGLEPVTDSSAATTAIPDGWSKDAQAQAAAMPPTSLSSTSMSASDAALPPLESNSRSSQGDVLAGFGSDLPLVIALQQIVPPGYQYSFTSGVNPGVSVSWEGGKPWQQVLSATLEKQNLGYRLQNNTVVIGTFGPERSMESNDNNGGMNSAQQPQSAAFAAAPSNLSANDADMPAPLWDTAGMDNTANNNRQPIVSPSTSASTSRANQLPADLGGYAGNSSDNAGMSANAAPMSAAPAVSADKPETVVIHRQKPSSLFERLGWAKSPKRAARNDADLRAANAAAATPAAPTVVDSSGSDLSLPPPVAASGGSQNNNGRNNGGAPERVASAATPQPLSMTDASPAPTPASAATAGGASGWSARRGDSLRDVLTAWSNRAGVKLYWSIDYDYRLTDNAGYVGAYDEAVGDLLGRFASVRPQPYGQLHQSADGSRVLVVKSYDLTR